MPSRPLLAAVDLGSNSFRLLVGRVLDGPGGVQIFPLDSLKETVRLASGLTKDKRIDGAAQVRALAALGRFGERLRSFAPDSVRAVATNTLRVAKNAREFLPAAEAALGFPIEVIAGREEARLIYAGVANTFPSVNGRMLVVDIGGGSTEFIIGSGHEPQLMESLFMGCVGYSLQFFPGGEIDQYTLKQAELSAQKEIEVIAHDFLATSWERAVGSSGTARALADIMEQNGFSDGGITREGLAQLRDLLLRAGRAEDVDVAGLKPDRIPVLPGGFAIMSAIFSVFGIERMDVTDGALRQGVLYDLLGRSGPRDTRDLTIEQFSLRYAVDRTQARRVNDLACRLLRQVMRDTSEERAELEHRLAWASTLHEIGLSISHAGYHKHSAYILANADMPGFSRIEQARVASLVLAHTGKLSKMSGHISSASEWLAVLCLRIGVLLARRRDDIDPPGLMLRRKGNSYRLFIDPDWLSTHPLTEFGLRQECLEWAKVGIDVVLEVRGAD